MGLATTILGPEAPPLAVQAVEIRDAGRDLLLLYEESGADANFYRNTQLWVNEASAFLGSNGLTLDETDPGLVTELGNVIDGVQNARLQFDPTKGGWFQKAFEAVNKTTIGREAVTQATELADVVDITKAGSIGRKVMIGGAVALGIILINNLVQIFSLTRGRR